MRAAVAAAAAFAPAGEITNIVLTFVFGALAVSLVLHLIWGVGPERREARQSHSQDTTFAADPY
jgi:hypothetical protein